MRKFIIKSLVVTACAWFLLFCFMPRYQSHPNNGQMLNVVSGQVYTWAGYKCR